MTALALRDDQTEWDKQQLAVLEANGIDSDVSEAELAAFLHECQRRKLDPFSRQIYLIGRYDRNKGRKVYRSQTSIDGFRLIARRAADRSGIDYSYEDTIWFDADGGRHEVWLSSKPPAAAKVVVIRNGQRFDAVARFGAYVQTNRDGNPMGLWTSMPDVLIAKCAEGLALRKAFPEDLGGIYTEEEMAQADNPQRVQAVSVEVVRDEPPRQQDEAPAEDPWLAAAMEKAPNHATLDACAAVWRESSARVHAGEMDKADASRLQAVLRKRMQELKDAAEQQSAAEEVVDGEVVTLDAEDPWAIAISEAVDAGEAERLLADARTQAGHGTMDADHLALIEQAIEEAFPGLTATEARAA